MGEHKPKVRELTEEEKRKAKLDGAEPQEGEPADEGGEEGGEGQSHDPE